MSESPDPETCNQELVMADTEEEFSPSQNQDTPQNASQESETADQNPKLEPTPPASAPPKIKHDWYQTQSDVYVNVMIKRLMREDVRVEFSERTLKVWIRLEEGREYSLEFHLAHQIETQMSSYKVLATKVEVKMRKTEGRQWTALERAEDEKNLPKLPQVEESKDDVHKYPSSSHHTRNWDQLVAEVKKEEKEEKMEGDAALNQLFQQIYKDGSDATRRAMNKSFTESGGTVLSTNWGEVGTNKVEQKPPDGMEWKKYDK